MAPSPARQPGVVVATLTKLGITHETDIGGHACGHDGHTAARLVIALTAIVAWSVDLMDAVVLTPAMIHGGSVSNQIPDEGTLTGKLRTFGTQVRAVTFR